MSESSNHESGDEFLELEVHNESDGEEPWLVSYADLMTLLFGFFAMLFTFATFEASKPSTSVELDSAIAKQMQASIESMKKVAASLNEQMKQMDAGKDIQLTLVEDGKGLEIAFDNAILFGKGSAELLPAASKPLLELMTVLKASGKSFVIRIEGHTDDNPILNAIRYPSNWELSGARASGIVRLFESHGFPSGTLTAVGYGSARPFLPNRDEKGMPIPDNQAKNRRVLVKVALDLQKMIQEQKLKKEQKQEQEKIEVETK